MIMHKERTDHCISYDEAIIKINREADILMLSFYITYLIVSQIMCGRLADLFK